MFNKSKKPNQNYIYKVHVRGNPDIKEFAEEMSREYPEIVDYKYEKASGEGYNVFFHSKIILDHEKLFDDSWEVYNAKVYYVEGEGKCFGLNDDGTPPNYY
ncbi:hypothetical protein ACFLSI_02570 [Bacteroidota bacterium]